jgi:hypothetical protein
MFIVTLASILKKYPLKKVQKEGIETPRFYGVAYFDYLRLEIVFYLIPLNLLVRLIRNIHFKLKSPWFKDYINEYQAKLNDRCKPISFVDEERIRVQARIDLLNSLGGYALKINPSYFGNNKPETATEAQFNRL